MTKEQLVRRVAVRLGIRAADAKPMVDAFCDTAVETLANNENIALANFGTFEIVSRRGPEGKRNVGVGFTTSRHLKKILNDRQK